MADLTDEQVAAANDRGRIALATTPRAKAVRYDRERRRLVIDLVNGSTFILPPELMQGFEEASADEIAKVEILGEGFGLRWEALDADFTVAGLLAGRFGTAKYMQDRFGPDWKLQAAE